MVQSRKRVSLATAKLRGHVKNGGCLGLFSRKPPQYLSAKRRKFFCQKRAFEESLRFLVDSRRTSIPNLIKVNRELRCVEWLSLAQVLTGSHNFVPRL